MGAFLSLGDSLVKWEAQINPIGSGGWIVPYVCGQDANYVDAHGGVLAAFGGSRGPKSCGLACGELG